ASTTAASVPPTSSCSPSGSGASAGRVRGATAEDGVTTPPLDGAAAGWGEGPPRLTRATVTSTIAARPSRTTTPRLLLRATGDGPSSPAPDGPGSSSRNSTCMSRAYEPGSRTATLARSFADRSAVRDGLQLRVGAVEL